MKKLVLLMFIALPMVAFSQSAENELAGYLQRNGGQITSLGEAFPDEKFDWRPADGVRSVREVLLHTASTNYYLLMNMGFELPAGVDLTKFESITGKAAVIEAVKKSFAFASEKAALVPGAALTEKVKLPFGEFSKKMCLLILLDHSGEHKGQLIAYARMNTITPPWSE